MGFYIPENGILLSHRRENLKSYIIYTCHIIRPLYLKKVLDGAFLPVYHQTP
jgi:hypothetical protein